MYKILSRDWFVLLATILLMVNCHSDMTLREQIESMRSSTVCIAPDSMFCLNGDTTFYTIEKNFLKLVVYVDSSECSSCAIDKLERWNLYMNKYKHVKDLLFLVILESRKANLEYVERKVGMTGMHTHVFIDTLSFFRRHNPQIPKDRMFHTFLLDESDSVVLVGNPMQNNQIDNLLKQIVDAHHEGGKNDKSGLVE